jgi:hypothetical protein
MKIRVMGLERSEGVSKAKPDRPGSGGKDYAIGRIHAAVMLDASRNGEKNMVKGTMGTTYDGIDVAIIKRLEHLPLPFDAEVTVEDVMRFGKRESKIMEVKPLGVVTQQVSGSAAPALKAA